MVRLIVLFPLFYFSLVQCHWHERNGHNRHYGYGFNPYWPPNKWLPKHPPNNPWLYPEWNTEPGFEDSFEEIPPNQLPIPVNQRPKYGYGPPQQNFPNNRRTYNTFDIPPVQNEPNDMLQALVDEVIAVDKKIKSICNRGHNPSEEYTEEYYKRMFNVEGYITETATVRIKHTVLYTCLDPVVQGWPCLEDVALLPENLNVKEAVYNIVNNNLIVKIPFKKNNKFMGGDVCRVGDIDEKVIIVSKESAVDVYGHIIDVRNIVRKKTDTEPAFFYRSN